MKRNILISILLLSISFAGEGQISNCPREMNWFELYSYVKDWEYCYTTNVALDSCDVFILSKFRAIYDSLIIQEQLEVVDVKSFRLSDSLVFFFPANQGKIPGENASSTAMISRTYCIDTQGYNKVRHPDVENRR